MSSWSFSSTRRLSDAGCGGSGSRDGPNAGMGLKLLSTGNSRRPNSDRARAVSDCGLRHFLRLSSVSAFLGPAVGRAIDQRGGRDVLAISNLVLAAGLVLLGTAQGVVTLSIAWAVLGVGMAMGLYEPAFATLTGLYGRAARGPITGITLIAGFASTVGWPLSAFLEAHYGWRGACLIWAGLHIVIGLPLNRLLIPRAPPPAAIQT